jgi:hypothetical protein
VQAKLDRPILHMRPIAQLDVSAASGIAVCDGSLYVLADDELTLARYDLAGRRAGEIRLLPGALPDGARERKAHKPDFEALVALPDGALLALGSGSTPSRRRGAWVNVSAGRPESRPIDLAPLYERLERELPELNIEGGAVLGDTLFLASRGNGARRENALVRVDWPSCARALQDTSVAPAEALRAIERVDLGELDAGHPLGFTDLATAEGRLLFTAAAEASPNTYDDGACAGSAFGVLTPSGAVSGVVILEPVTKVEGVCAASSRDALELLFVADPDERLEKAPLMAASYRLTAS